MQPLADRHELAGVLNDLLGHYRPEEGGHGGHLGLSETGHLHNSVPIYLLHLVHVLGLSFLRVVGVDL